jgi:hypothetical protein
MNKILAFLIFIIPIYSFANDRPVMEDNIFDIRYPINQIEQMANDQNVDGFLDCYTNSRKKKIQKQTAISFAQHEVEMDVDSIYVVKEGKTNGELIVRYTTTINKIKHKYVSLIQLKKENNYWKISSETVKGLEIEVPRLCSPSRYGMIAGRMRLLSPPEY